eukprot:CAMPEP_0176467090 /NCGR_PEP_ID=MMETSP0127-20121128/38264_1 /TAXON_ID=938130 /ORGANISM="Platyophrya macrostoma, Strain WH" /LENGTH=665 /DNA_ID=CAMNT_0017860349 /DNA_START=49 /DNA_END=2047 /DNA_ORIENTATION=-
MPQSAGADNTTSGADEDNLKTRQRVLDNNRQKYQQAAQTQMSKQQESISTLKKENEKMKQDLAATTGGSYDFNEQDKLANLQGEAETLERKVQYEKMRKNDISKKLSMSRMDVMKSRKGMGGVNITSENTAAVEKQIKVLENRLDQALVKFNEALAYNKSLREQIDNLREERKVFQRIYKKLESELHEKKKAMAEKIERANQDYEERDTLQQQLEALRQAAKEDQKKYEENFASIEAAMQQFKSIRDLQMQSMKSMHTTSGALGTSGGGATGSGLPMNGAAQSTNGGGGAGGKHHGQLSPDSPSSPTHSHKKGQSSNNLNDTRHSNHNLNDSHDGTQHHQEDETDLQDVVDQLKEATGIQDLDVLYHKFLKAEEHNFSTYNFVNELNTEVEELEKEIAGLRDQLAGEKGDATRRKMLKDLENDLAQTEQQYERLQAETHRHRENLSVIRSVTQEVFQRIGCSADVARELCGAVECNELNLQTFLGLVEQRTTDILAAYHNAAQNEQRRQLASKGEEAGDDVRQARLEAGEHVPPEAEDDAEEEDDAAYASDSAINTSTDGTGAASKQSAAVVPRFIGVGPSVAHNTVSASQLVRQHGLPNTNAGDAQTDNNDDVDEDNILSHEALRQQMEQRLQQRREKDERGGGRAKRKGGAGGGNKPAQSTRS